MYKTITMIRNKLKIWNKISVWGALASLFAIPLSIVLYSLSKPEKPLPSQELFSQFIQPYSLKFDNNYFDGHLRTFNGLMTQWPTTDPNFRRMGEVAAELLIARIESKKTNMLVEKIMPCPLLIPPDNSTQPIAVS